MTISTLSPFMAAAFTCDGPDPCLHPTSTSPMTLPSGPSCGSIGAFSGEGGAAVAADGVGTVGLVIAGAGARGAYEMGALSVLLPWLRRHGQSPRIVVGTSAGAMN